MDSFHRYHFIYVQLLERISMFRVMNRQSNCLVRKFCDTEMWFVVEKKNTFYATYCRQEFASTSKQLCKSSGEERSDLGNICAVKISTVDFLLC